MNRNAFTLSILMAVIAVFFVQSYVSSIEEEAKKKFGTEVIVVAAKTDVKEMEPITESSIEFTKIPKKYLEPGAITFEGKGEESEEARNKSIKDLVGSIAVVPIKKGELITYNKITVPSLRSGLAPQITPGKRAMAIPVSEVSAVGKLIKPGDRVDVIAVLDRGAGKEYKMAKTVMQDIVILAVGRSITNNVPRLLEYDPYNGKEKIRNLTTFDGYSSATLEVDPNQALMLAAIQANGDTSIWLTLRNNDDTDKAPLPSVMLDDVLGSDANRIPAKATGGAKK